MNPIKSAHRVKEVFPTVISRLYLKVGGGRWCHCQKMLSFWLPLRSKRLPSVPLHWDRQIKVGSWFELHLHSKGNIHQNRDKEVGTGISQLGSSEK